MATFEEFRNCRNACIALVTSDTIEAYETGQVMPLAPLAEISKTTATASEAKYYDGSPLIVVNAEGADTVTLTTTVIPLKTLAMITGKKVDAKTGALMDGPAKPVYFALGYILEKTDGTNRYVWRYKCSASIPDESGKTATAGTETSNQQITITGINTIHKFTKPQASQKALVVDESDGLADLTTFFNEVTTCDTLRPLNSDVSSEG
ncbi:hypothetical protein DWX17_21575 [[Clostridium] innocuum]|uniref:major tail protein n=1 Tax=Clostridium innocuum TaxID=1522 RepID=UPI000E478FA6|nr:major tail protein [[Clostridium] innocuum]RGT61653.1 hypothetical protein DWX17_21575 [[Clostridium] innocuum]RJV84188.1 hypothetical protein DWX45_18990 [Erysipelotrichaceae bacterium AF19-24AC]